MTTKQSTSRRLVAAALLVSAGAGVAGLLGPMATANATPTTVPAPPPASDRYVAIAYSPSIQFTGLSINASKQGAANEALYRCSTKARDCQVVINWKNGCAALAVDGTRFFGGAGPSYAAANNDARSGLGGFGAIKASQCVVR